MQILMDHNIASIVKQVLLCVIYKVLRRLVLLDIQTKLNDFSETFYKS